MLTLETSSIKKVFQRFSKYVVVGVSTYLIDLAIVAFLTYLLGIHYAVAVAIGFFIGITLNYQVTYHWIFEGTKRKKLTGYAIFGSLGLIGIMLITSMTMLLVEWFGLELFVARTIVGAGAGIIGFVINSIFNFRML